MVDSRYVLSIVHANEVAQASFAKARYVVQNSPTPTPVADAQQTRPLPSASPNLGAAQVGLSSLDGSGHPVNRSVRNRNNKKPLLAPSRSSLRIKNLSFK